MFELYGILVLKALGHGWLWRRGERIDADLVYGNGGTLFIVGFAGVLMSMILGFILLVMLGRS